LVCPLHRKVEVVYHTKPGSCEEWRNMRGGQVKFWGEKIEDSQKPSGSLEQTGVLKGFMDPNTIN